MNCPQCSHPLIVLELESIEVDHCVQCKGVWLDAGELELLLDGAANRDSLLSGLLEQVEDNSKDIRCPICRKHMKLVYVGKSKRVALDICAHDHGIWFDSGELRDVIGMGEFSDDNKVYDLVKDIFAAAPDR